MRHVKAARRQAYRYGQQYGELVDRKMDAEASRVQAAYRAFMHQFDPTDDEILVNRLQSEYNRGALFEHPLSAAGDSDVWRDKFYADLPTGDYSADLDQVNPLIRQ